MRASTAAGRASPRTASMAWTSERRIGLLVDRGQDPLLDLARGGSGPQGEEHHEGHGEGPTRSVRTHCRS